MRRIGIIAILGLVLVGCSSEPTTQNFNPPAIPVLTTEVTVQDVPVHIESIGTLKPSSYVEIRPQVSGKLEQHHFKEGEMVTEGTLLMSIHSASYKNKVLEAKAQLAQDQAAYESTQKKLRRYESLAKKDLIPQQEWDELEAQLLKNEGAVLADEAKLSNAEIDLENCRIISPITGRIGKLNTHSGNIVAAAQTNPLATIASIDPVLIDFTLTEKEFLQLIATNSKEMSIEISPLNSKDSVGHGKIAFVDHSFDEKTGLLLVRATCDNGELGWLPGMGVRVKLPVSVIKDAKVVLQRAVKINQQGPYVFVVGGDNVIEIRQLKVGDEIDDKVIVLEGLSAGEVVVTDGHLRLAPGLKVEIKKE